MYICSNPLLSFFVFFSSFGQLSTLTYLNLVKFLVFVYQLTVVILACQIFCLENHLMTIVIIALFCGFFFLQKRDTVLTIPNVLTVMRMGLAPVIGYLVLHEAFSAAFALFIAAGISDLVRKCSLHLEMS